MDCPKCGAPQSDRNTICARCGIVFEKYWKYHPRPGTLAPERTPSAAQTRAIRSPAETDADPLAAWARALLLGLLTLWSLFLIGSSLDSNVAGKSFLHLVNLPFHEAGHVFFRPLGQFVASLGGTLGQLLMPAICAAVLLFQTRDPFGASVAIWWLGESFLDIAPYMADARAGTLPLIGGNFGHSAPYGFHDWEYLLTEMGLMQMDRTLAQASHVLGSAIMLAALAWGALLVYRQLTVGR